MFDDSNKHREREAFSNMLKRGQLPCPLSLQDKKALQKAGFRLRGDSLLMDVTMPSGWRVIQTDNRCGQLLDPEGRVRGKIFYKEAIRPSESGGYVQMLRRYTIFTNRPGNSDCCAWDCVTKTVLFENSLVNRGEQYRLAKAWLDKNYPKWRDPTKYWDRAERSRWKFWRR